MTVRQRVDLIVEQEDGLATFVRLAHTSTLVCRSTSNLVWASSAMTETHQYLAPSHISHDFKSPWLRKVHVLQVHALADPPLLLPLFALAPPLAGGPR